MYGAAKVWGIWGVLEIMRLVSPLKTKEGRRRGVQKKSVGGLDAKKP